jgi:hypothetical protein
MEMSKGLQLRSESEAQSCSESDLTYFFSVEVINKVRSGQPVADEEFDRLFPEKTRALSEIHWTPVSTARRAAELAVRKPNDLVLDIGSGVGKFCVVGSLTTAGNFFGVEQREYLLRFARQVVTRYRIPRVQLIFKNMVELDWRPYDAIYLFNPFYENLDESIRIDDLYELSSDLYVKYIRQTQQKLAGLNTGTRIVTLNGFGGDFPPSYRLIQEEEVHFLPLQVWEKY